MRRGRPDGESTRPARFGLFSRIFITAEGLSGADLLSSYAQLLDPAVEDQVAAEREAIQARRLGDLLNEEANGPTAHE